MVYRHPLPAAGLLLQGVARSTPKLYPLPVTSFFEHSTVSWSIDTHLKFNIENGRRSFPIGCW